MGKEIPFRDRTQVLHHGKRKRNLGWRKEKKKRIKPKGGGRLFLSRMTLSRRRSQKVSFPAAAERKLARAAGGELLSIGGKVSEQGQI